ncbi:MAG: TonB-dependent receptor plug domain-containing protein, partial [Gemmatimonadaceae bacterium]
MNHSVLRGTRRSILAGCSVLALLPLARSHAQAVPDTARLRAVIVTADRLPRPVDRTPSSVTVLSGETLRASGITQLADALRGVPGVNAVGSGSLGAQTSLFMRGGESDYVKVLVDGVVMNDPGGAIDLATINLANVERIEIVRGPASVQYGSDAVSGVIQIFTRQAQAPVDAQLTLRGGSYGTAIADGSLGLRGGRGWLTLGVAHHESEGMLAFNNEYRNDIVSLGTEWRAASRTTARWSLRRSDNEFHYPTDGSGRVVDRNARRGDRRLSSSVEVAHVFGPRVEGIVSFGSLNAHGRTDDASDGAADTLGFHAYRSHGVVRRRTGDARLI